MIRLDYKIKKASTHDFGKKVSSCFFFWDKMGLDVMSDDYLVRKQAVLEYKILYFT